MRLRLRTGFICVVLLTVGTALGQTKIKDQVSVVTVCDILFDQSEFNGKTIAVLGRFVASDEGAWLVEDGCGREIEANGIPVRISMWLEQRGISPKTLETPVLNQDA